VVLLGELGGGDRDRDLDRRDDSVVGLGFNDQSAESKSVRRFSDCGGLAILSETRLRVSK
jgi:hypothetical protein